MKSKRKFTPYIRRRHPRDKSKSIRVAFQMAAYGDCFVLVQRGVRPRLAMACGKTRAELRRSLAGAMTRALRRPGGNWKRPSGVDFRRWASGFGRFAREET